MQTTLFFPAWRHQLGPMRSTKTAARSLRPATLAQIETRLAPALPASVLAPGATADFSRERIFSLFRTFWCWVWQILQTNTSCREVVRQVQALFALDHGPSVDEATGAYCQARAKLPLSLLEKALEAVTCSTELKIRSTKILQGRPLKVLDGSNARLSDTPANRKQFPPPNSLPSGAGFPLLKIVVLFSLASGAILARATGNQHMHEARLCEKLRRCFHELDVIVADRAYAIFSVVAWLKSLGVDMIARVPTRCRRVDFRRAKKHLGPGQALFSWIKTAKGSTVLPLAEWRGLPKQITVRILRVHVKQKGFRTQRLTLATTLLDPVKFPAEQIIAAYARRWRLEMSLDDLKTTLGMEHLRCRCPDMVQKELLMFLLAHNLLRWLMAQAAQHEDVDLDRISFKGSLDAFRQWTQALVQLPKNRRARKAAELWAKLLCTLARDLVPDRPGRREPRAVKRRSKYPHLNCLRRKYRDRYSRNQQRVLATAKRGLNVI